MNRFNWTYLADFGKKHHVGLMHGAESGHLLIYCDAKIILIDFKVLDDKTYTFFIDDQLCEIAIERINGQFYYGFEINKKADTPRNRMRRKIEKRHLRQSLLFLAGAILIISAFTYFMVSRDGRSTPQDYQYSILQNNGREGKAKIMKVSSSEITYFYVVNGQSYSAETRSSDPSIIVLENGMPMEEGDEFIITYAPNNPNLNKIDYNRPTPAQVERYRQRAISQHLSSHPETDSLRAVCIVDLAFEAKGISGLADIYFQKASPDDNPRNNKNTYGRLVRDIPFQNKMNERCWN